MPEPKKKKAPAGHFEFREERRVFVTDADGKFWSDVNGVELDPETLEPLS